MLRSRVRTIFFIIIFAIHALTLCRLHVNAEAASPPPTDASSSDDLLIDRKILFGNPVRTQGRISPDGTKLSWLAPSNGVLNVWVAPLTDLEDGARVLTDSSARPPQGAAWTANSRYILFGLDDGGDENTHVYAVDVETGEQRDLTPVGEGVKAVIVSYRFGQPNTLIVGLNERDPQVFDLYEIDIETGQRNLLLENDGGYLEFIFDDANEVRGALAQQSNGSTVVYKLVVGQNDDEAPPEFEEFFVIPSEDTLTTYPYLVKGDSLYMLDTRGRDKAAFVSMNFTTGGEVTVIAESDLADVSDISFDQVTLEPTAFLVDYLYPTWTALEGEYGEVLAAAEAKFGNDFAILSATADRSKYVIAGIGPTLPLVYFLFDKAANEFTELFVTRPDLDATLLQPMEAFEIEARDGLILTSYLTLPVGADADGDGIPEQPLPMILFVHGGPWARDSYNYNPYHQMFANRGYATMSVNYRGSTGFGKSFVNAAIKEFAGKMHDDLIDAVDYAISSGIADADRVAIMGGSYGGYATLVGLTFTPDTFACGVDIVGISSLVTVIESFPDYWAPALAGTWYKFVGNPANETERADMIGRSPLYHVENITAPLLIGQGENDPRVTKLESDQMVDEMANLGKAVTYLNYPDEGHGFARPENSLSFMAVAENFLSQCLGGIAQDYGDDFEGSTIEVLHGAEYVPGLSEELEGHGAPSSTGAEGNDTSASLQLASRRILFLSILSSLVRFIQ